MSALFFTAMTIGVLGGAGGAAAQQSADCPAGEVVTEVVTGNSTHVTYHIDPYNTSLSNDELRACGFKLYPLQNITSDQFGGSEYHFTVRGYDVIWRVPSADYVDGTPVSYAQWSFYSESLPHNTGASSCTLSRTMPPPFFFDYPGEDVSGPPVWSRAVPLAGCNPNDAGPNDAVPLSPAPSGTQAAGGEDPQSAAAQQSPSGQAGEGAQTGAQQPQAAGAGAGTEVTGASKATNVCGKLLGKNKQAQPLRQYKSGGKYDLGARVRPTLAGSRALLRFGSGCAHGYKVTYAPKGHVKQEAVVRAKDGRIVAIQLKARRSGKFTVTATRGKTAIKLQGTVAAAK
jgi:hypothetical protein